MKRWWSSNRGNGALALTAIFLTVFSLAATAQTDTTPPVTAAAPVPSSPDGLNGWYRSPVNFTLTAADLESGVKEIRWRMGGGLWQSKTFAESLNLAPNPSFESGSGSSLDSWNFAGTAGALGIGDTSVAKFGLSSARIEATSNGLSGWNHRLAYAVAPPFANMSASVWVRTANVAGVGAYFKVFALTSGGEVELARSSTIVGSAGWQLLSKSFTVSSTEAYGVYLDLILEGVGTVWYDGVYLTNSLSEVSANFTAAQNGGHALEYYSVDQMGNEELPHPALSFKIDTTAPYNWRDFSTEREGGDHELKARITVDDLYSGLERSASRFQYSVDGGTHWGYYVDSGRCQGTWVEGGWSAELAFPYAAPEDKTLTLETPKIDFCNSNWSICKIVRFKAVDKAGSESTKDICLNGAWLKVNGDTYAGEGINMGAAGAEDNSDGLIITPGNLVSNFSSSNNWIIANYSSTWNLPAYEGLLQKFPSLTPMTVLPKISGNFVVDGNFTVDNATIPSGLPTANFGAVVFIDGDLVIKKNYSLGNGGALIFIVNGDLLIDKEVEDVAGFFIVSGRFDSAYNGGGATEALTLRGGLAAQEIILSRSLKSDNEEEPAEMVNFEPKYYLLLGKAFSSYRISWQEVSP